MRHGLVNFWAGVFTACVMSYTPIGMSSPKVTALSSSCIRAASQGYEVHPDILYAILLVEGGTVGANSKPNENGSYDIGPFQINSMHRSKLISMGISEEELRDNGCLNAAVAAWHLHSVLTPDVLGSVKDEDSYLSAIARYHSATPKYNLIYAKKLKAAFAYLYSQDTK